MLALRRILGRFGPLVLSGCTMLSGVASLETGDEQEPSPPLEQNNTSGDSSAATIAPEPPPTTIDGSFSKDANAKKAPGDQDAGDDDDDDPIDAGPASKDSGGSKPDASPGPTDAGVDAGTVTVTYNKTLVEDQEQQYGPFKAKGGTMFEARTTGSGDPDLYLRFGAPPNDSDDDCASEGGNANERCRRTVPAAGSDVYLVVYAWDDCSYTLTVTYTPQ